MQKAQIAQQYTDVSKEQRLLAKMQNDLLREMTGLLKDADALRSRLPLDKQKCVTQIITLATKHDMRGSFDKIASKLNTVTPDRSWAEGNLLQKRVAEQLQEMTARMPAAAARPAFPAQEQRSRGLSLGTFTRIRELVKPSAGENSWLKVKWVGTLWEAHEKAVKDGKPIAIFTTGGEPLGIC